MTAKILKRAHQIVSQLFLCGLEGLGWVVAATTRIAGTKLDASAGCQLTHQLIQMQMVWLISTNSASFVTVSRRKKDGEE
jgi:hypothetical protein